MSTKVRHMWTTADRGLLLDPDISLTEVARRLNVTAGAVSSQVKELRKAGVRVPARQSSRMGVFCSILMDDADICGLPVYSRGFCRTHYSRSRRPGLSMGAPFHVPRDGGCRIVMKSGDPCARKVEAKGLCGGHYSRFIGRSSLGMEQEFRIREPDRDGNWPCNRCGLYLPQTTDFWNRHETGWYGTCKRCRIDKRNNLDVQRRWRLLNAQSYKCAFPGCENVIELFGRHTYNIDHNHCCCPDRSCGKCIRGLLCRQCNTMLCVDREYIFARCGEFAAYLNLGNPHVRTAYDR